MRVSVTLDIPPGHLVGLLLLLHAVLPYLGRLLLE